MKKITALLSIILSAVILMNVFTVFAIDVPDQINTPKQVESSKTEINKGERYSDYLERFSKVDNASDIVIATEPVSSTGKVLSEYEGKQNVVTVDENGEILFNVNVITEGMYSLNIEYNSTVEKFGDYKFSIKIDGTLPHELANAVRLRKVWENTAVAKGGKFITRNGNDILPQTKEINKWQSEYLYDVEGNSSSPLKFYFSKGQHKIGLTFDLGNIAIANLTLKNPPIISKYKDVLESWKNQGLKEITNVKPIKIEAEYINQKSSADILPTTNRNDAVASPQSGSKILLNTIGEDWSFSEPGEWVSYKVIVPKEGLYNIDMRAAQNMMRGINVYRELWINGIIQYDELKNICFKYDTKYYIKTVGDNNSTFVHLIKGENILTLRANYPYSDIRNSIINLVFDANKVYRKIIMITGVNPDSYNDYKLDTVMTDLIPTLKSFSNRAQTITNELYKLGFVNGGEIVTVEQFKSTIDSLIAKPDSIPLRLDSYTSIVSGLTMFYFMLGEQPLSLDYILVTSKDAKPPKANASFFENVVHSFSVYISTYTNDYNTISEFKDGEAINVWINMGRDQAQVVRELVENDFMQKHNINVNVNLVQQALIPATLSGDGPEVSIFTTSIDTINLAVRNTLLPLNEFPDFNDVKTRFQSKSTNLYTYNGNCYGLPISESFYMMFCRMDILEELGLKPPKTWQEFNNILVTLQRNNLTVGIPSPDSEIDASTGGVQFAMYETLLFQNDANYYKGNWWTSGIADTKALSAFNQLTDFFSKYSVPTAYDFYTRFRSGEMPIGIQKYAMYNQLKISAPEINGLWKMNPIPGVLQKDGTINQKMSTVGASAVIFKKTKNKQAAWEFVKWYTSNNIQSEYGKRIELMLGTGARPETANVEAFKSYPWTTAEKDLLLSQWKNLESMSLTPVSYYVNRNVTNAFRKVVYQGENTRETLNYYNDLIQREMNRKKTQIKE